MKEECIKFTKWIFKRKEIELTFDVDDMWDEYEFEQKPRNFGMCRINWEVGNYYGVDPLWIKAPGQETIRVRYRRIAQRTMLQLGHRHKSISTFYNVSRANISQGMSTINNEIETNLAVRVDAGNILKIFRKFE